MEDEPGNGPHPKQPAPQENGSRDRWATIEKISKTLSAVAIPLVLAFGGWFIQKQLQNQAVSRDYVQLAVSILREPDTTKVKPELRTWAVDLLQANSPIKLSKETESKLRNGELTLPLPETFTAVASSDLNPELKAASEARLNDFQGYLIRAGFKVSKGDVKYEFVTGDSIKRDGAEFYSLYDPDTNTLQVAAAFKDDQNFLMHEYMRHVLSPSGKRQPSGDRVSPSWAYFAIESGLADYFTCSYTQKPNWESKGDISVNLLSRHRFDEISLSEVFSNDKAAVVWGGAFWELRQKLAKDVADKLLASAWNTWYPSDSSTDASAEFVNKLVEIHQASGGQSGSAILDIFRSRGWKV